MSVRSLSRVWEHSRHGGTELLMLLAIADFADDDGRAYPAVATLATKCRMTARNANLLLAKLRTSGELEVSNGTGPRGTNTYRLRIAADTLTLASPRKPASPLKPVSAPEAHFTPEADFTLTQASATHEGDFPLPLKPASTKPSLNRQEPSTGRSGQAADRPPAAPMIEIIEAYHQALPSLPRVRLFDQPGRKKAVRAFWNWVLSSKNSSGERRASNVDEALAWIRAYFERASANDFLMGRAQRSPEHAHWRADFDYLLTDKGMRQVIEKTEVSA